MGQRLAALLGGFVLAAILGAAAWHAPLTVETSPSMATDGSGTAATAFQPPGSLVSSPAVSPSASPTPAAPATGREHPEATGIRPVRVRITAIGVAAPVIDLGLNDDDTLEAPEAFDQAGWWTGGAAPGADGPAVVAGHVDSHAGPGVFYRLRELRPGDRIELRDRDGRVVRFAVDRLEQHPKDDFPTAAVYGDTARPTLRLITCGGAFDRSVRSYIDNVIVYASLVA